MRGSCLGCAAVIPVDTRRCTRCQGQYDAARVTKTADRGYGAKWQAVSEQVRKERGQCEWCGSTEDLTVDHRDGEALGPQRYDPSNLRVLCRPCHGRRTVEASTRGVGVDRD